MLETGWALAGLALYLLMFGGAWQSRWRWYFVPLMPWIARSWFLVEPGRAFRFLVMLTEGLRGFQGWRPLLDSPPLVLAFAASCAVPALSATTWPDALSALAFGAGMLLSLGYLRQFERDLRDGWPIADQMLLAFTVLAWIYKFAYGYQLGISPLMVRGGGVYASNQYISVALCLMPMVRSRWLLLAAVLTVLLQFSRGGFVGLLLLGLLLAWRHDAADARWAWSDLLRLRILAGAVLALGAGVVLLAVVAPEASKFLFIRMVGGGAFGLNIGIADRLAALPLTDLVALAGEAARGDDRNLIWSTAMRVAADHFYAGTGVGNFVTAASTLNAELLYSNAHNLYLTLLAEIGLASVLLFVLMLLHYALRAFRSHTPAFAALVTFAVYGLFSGQIYETSSEYTIAQYIVLLFVFACVEAASPPRASSTAAASADDSR